LGVAPGDGSAWSRALAGRALSDESIERGLLGNDAT